MPEIEFYHAPGACSLAPHILLHMAGLSFTPKRVALFEGEHLTEDFARINPKRRVPVLVLDGETITEVPAIATAISELAPERAFMGRTRLERARVHEWMNWLSGTLHGQAFAGLWRPQRFSDDETILEQIQAKGRKTISECFDFIEERIQTPFALGDAFTAADAFLLVFYRWGNGVGFDMAADYPNYARLARNIAALDAAKAAADAEEIDVLRDHPPRFD